MTWAALEYNEKKSNLAIVSYNIEMLSGKSLSKLPDTNLSAGNWRIVGSVAGSSTGDLSINVGNLISKWRYRFRVTVVWLEGTESRSSASSWVMIPCISKSRKDGKESQKGA